MLRVDEARLMSVAMPIEPIGVSIELFDEGHTFAGVSMLTGVDPALQDLNRD